MNPAPDDPSLDLEGALRLDALAEEYRQGIESGSGLSPEAFAARHPDVEAELLAVLRGMAILAGTRRAAGPVATGATVGPYRVLGELGRGGMGVVYEAVEEGLGRVVALKVFDVRVTDPKFRARFQREARAAARLDHSAIVPVFGTGEDGDVLWYAMRRVEGVSLDLILAALSSGDQSERWLQAEQQLGVRGSSSTAASGGSGLPRHRVAAAIGQKLADALSYAHAEGVLHRDIKPGNVLLDRDGSPVLTDFGLCKVEGDASLTADTDIVGTFRYLPPEALHGRADARGDVYGLGLVIYELLARQPAFEGGDRNSLLHRILNEDPTPLAKIDPALPEDLGRVVAKATAKLPEERYATAADLAEDLGAFLVGQPVRARAPSALYLAQLFVRRNRALVAVALGALATVALLVGLHVARLDSMVEELREARDESASREVDALTANAEATLQTGDVDAARRLLEQIRPESRGWMWGHLAARVGIGVPTTAVEPDIYSGIAALPDSDQVVEFTRSTLSVRSASTLEVHSRIDTEGVMADGVFPTGRGTEVIVHALWRGDPFVWSGESDSKIRQIKTRVGELVGVTVLSKDLAPGNEPLVISSDDVGQVVAVGVDTGREAWRFELEGGAATSLAPLRDGVLAGMPSGEVWSYDGADRRLELVGELAHAVTAIHTSEGCLVATGTAEGELRIGPIRSPRGRLQFGSRIDGIHLKPNGRELVVVLSSGETPVVDLDSVAVTTWLPGARSKVTGVACLGTGEVLARTDGGDLLRHAPGAHDGRRLLFESLGSTRAVGMSRDGAYRFAQTGDGLLHLLESRTGKVRTMPVSSGSASPRFGPRGRFFALGGTVHRLSDLKVVHSIPTASGFWTPDGAWTVIQRVNAADRSSTLAVHRWVPDVDPAPVEVARLDRVATKLKSRFLSLDPEGRRLFVGGFGGLVTAYSLDTWEELWHVPSTGPLCRGVRYLKGDKILLVPSTAGMIDALDPATGERIEERSWRVTPANSMARTVINVSYSPDESTVVLGTQDGRVELWRIADGRRLGALVGSGGNVRFARHLDDSGWVVVGAADGQTYAYGSGELPEEWSSLGRAVPSLEDNAGWIIRAFGREPSSKGVKDALYWYLYAANANGRGAGQRIPAGLRATLTALDVFGDHRVFKSQKAKVAGEALDEVPLLTLGTLGWRGYALGTSGDRAGAVTCLFLGWSCYHPESWLRDPGCRRLLHDVAAIAAAD